MNNQKRKPKINNRKRKPKINNRKRKPKKYNQKKNQKRNVLHGMIITESSSHNNYYGMFFTE
jgi:hypothetical protein